ncbi:MAG TPA: hypothetical protein VGH44_00530 [Candidatus Saccharimonadia bacterium]|jgi:cytoskeletal protein RodZ
MKKSKIRGHNKRLLTISAIAVILVILILAAVLFFIHTSNSKQSATKNYDPQTKTSGSSKDQSSGVTDNISPSPTHSGSPSASPAAASGITLSNPPANSKISSGTIISGSDPGVSSVYYRIKDNVAGVLTTGILTVNSSGQFSGTVSQLHPSGTSGYVEVYNVDPSTGVESHNVKVPVTF